MTVLVTGASGFIGGHLTRALVNQGESVRVLVRANSSLIHLAGLPISVSLGDLSDQNALNQAADGVRMIFHCAALSSDWGTRNQFFESNVYGVQRLLRAAKQNSTLERFVHISTSDVYGYPHQPCDETYPLTDVSLPYNTSKIQGEQAVWKAFHDDGLPVTVIRPVSVYGPRGTEFVQKIAEFLRENVMAVFDGGHTNAGLLYIDNAVEFILAAARSPIALGQAYTIRDDSDISWRTYIDTFAAALGMRRPWLNLPSPIALRAAHALEAAYYVLPFKGHPLLTRHAIMIMCRTQGYSIEKARHDLGFRSTVSFDEGLDRSAVWMKTQFGR